MKNYCYDDFDFLEEHYQDYFKVKNKNDSNLYYIKKYTNKNLDIEKIEQIQKLLFEMTDITNLKYKGLFTEEKEKRNNLYLVFEYFEGKLVCSKNEFKNYELWIIAKNLLEVFEKLNQKGIKFHKNTEALDVFGINLNEIKINIFELIINDFEDYNLKKDENDGILFNIGIILDKIKENNYISKELINDLKNNKIDILTTKTLFNLFLRYSLRFDNNDNYEIINYNGMLYSGSLKDNKPDGTGVLLNEYGIVYKGEFEEGNINGKGKLFIYNKNIESQNKKPKNNNSSFVCKNPNYNGNYKTQNQNILNKNILKIFEGSFINGKKKGKYIEYDKYNSKIFEGELIDDIKQGKGIEYLNGYKKYEGEFKDNMRNGKGVEYNYGYKVYEGEFKDNMRNGKGVEYNYGSKMYEGEFKDNMRNGKGIEYCNNNKIYEGDFNNGEKDGIGILYTNEGIKRYEGNFEKNIFNGKGTLFYDNGKIHYYGQFNNGLFSGEGYYCDNSGERIKVLNGFPLLNEKFPKRFKTYYNSGNIHYEISFKRKDKILYGQEFSEDKKLKYSGDFKTVNMYEKEKEKINLEQFRNKDEYIYLIKDGNGVSYNSEGNKEYIGGFKFNSFNGKGKFYRSFNNKEYYLDYEGSFLNGKYHGEGIKYYFCIDTKLKEYEGTFKYGNYEGKGIKFKVTGEQEYKGTFSGGCFTSGFENTQDYIGEIKDGKKEGKGKKFIDNKLRFEGLFKNNKFIKGTVYDINKKKFFEGIITDDNKKEGIFFCEDNNFVGNFEDFSKVADYIIDFTNNCEIIYEGEYKNGMKCGNGKYYPCGYEGEFLYDMYHGTGKLSSDNIKGEFKNGKKTGFWKETDFEGQYKDGLRNGKGTEDSWTGFYVNNYLHGIRKKEDQKKLYYFGEEANILNLRIESNCIYFNGIKEFEGDLVKGNKHGKGIEYYKNSKKRYEGDFQNGMHHGKGKEYYDNEILKYEGEFKNNVYDKKGIEYDEKGQIIYEGEFKSGKYHGKGKLYRNGKIIYEGDFVENKLHGIGKEFNEKGKVFYSGEFKNNTYDGFGTRYLVRPYEGYWSNNRPDKLKQGLYYIGKYLNLA